MSDRIFKAIVDDVALLMKGNQWISTFFMFSFPVKLTHATWLLLICLKNQKWLCKQYEIVYVLQ